MFVISVIAFAIQDGLGDPLQEMVGMSVSEEEREAIREEVGLNDPMVVQYLRFAGMRSRVTWATPISQQADLEVIAEHLPATLELVIGASLIIVFSPCRSVSMPLSDPRMVIQILYGRQYRGYLHPGVPDGHCADSAVLHWCDGELVSVRYRVGAVAERLLFH